MIGRITPRKLNADTDDRSLSADEMKKAVNISVDSDSDGDGGVVKLSDGNTSIASSDNLSGVALGINTVIGSVSDEELGVVYFFVHNSEGNHGVYAYSSETNTYRKIFSSSTLDFDENGFVKGDIVRIKRQYEKVAPETVINQGGSGGTVVDTGTGGGGPTEPVGELTPSTITLEIGRDLYPLIELNGYFLELENANADSASVFTGNFKVVVTGSYTPASTGASPSAKANAVPVDFYASADLDLNVAQESTQEVNIQAFPELQINATSGLKSVFLNAIKNLYVHPDVTTDGTLSITATIKPVDDSFEFTTVSKDYVVNYTAKVTSGGMTEDIVFDNVTSSSISSVGENSDNHPVIKIPNKTRLDLTVSDVYGDTYITYDTPDAEGYLLELQKKILGARINELTNEVSYEVESDVPEMKLVDRTVPVKVQIDYANSPSYIEFKERWEDQQTANTEPGLTYDVPAAEFLPTNRSVFTDDTTCDVVYFTFCPLSMNWSIVGQRPGSISYQNPDETFKSYNELVTESLSWYSSNSDDITPWVGGADSYTSISAIDSEIASALGGRWFSEGGYTYPNWIAVQVFLSDGVCSVPDPLDVFNPVLVAAPVVQSGETKYSQPRVIAPYDYPGQDLSGPEAIDEIAANSVYTFVVDMPLAWRHGIGMGATEEYDFILISYNNSDYAAFRGSEDVIGQNYDAHIKMTELSGPFAEIGNIFTAGELNEGINDLQIFTDEERFVPYSYSVSGNPAELESLKGRRMRVSFVPNGQSSLGTVIQKVISLNQNFNGSNKFTGLALTPYSAGTSDSKKFCFQYGTSCVIADQLPPPVNTRIPDAPVINEGDGQVSDGGLTVTTTTSTTDTTKEVTPESSTLSLPTKETTTTTKETIKKKY
jgi:hypothetical protein